MERRQFLNTMALAGLGLSIDPVSTERAFSIYPSIEFLTRRTRDSMVFPRPEADTTVDISPPGFVWLPAKDGAGYRIEIRRRSDDQVVYTADLDADPEHRPDEVLEPGTSYTWDVLALDENGQVAAQRGEQVFTIGDQVPELPWVEPRELLDRAPDEHPRLIYTTEKLEEIRQTLQSTRKNSWQKLKQAADNALNLPPIKAPEFQYIEDRTKQRLGYGEYYHYFRGYINDALQDLALAYLVTKEEKYAERAKRILLEVASWPRGWDEVTSVQMKFPGDELGLSLAQASHRAYDWLYDALSPAERQEVLALCEDVAGQVYRRLSREHNYLTYSGGSHPARIIAYLSEMALVMKNESPEAEKWLDYSLTGLSTFYPHWGGSHGGWAEGIGYGLWYNLVYMPAFEALRLTTDYNLWKRPFFRKIRYFFLYCTSIRGEIRPFGDGAEKGGPAEISAFAEFMGYHAKLYDDPQVGWWAKETGQWEGASGTLSLVFEDDLPSEPPADLPQARAFWDAGWAGLHSSLAEPEKDTFFLFKSSPYGSVSHSHADQNAFAIMKGGKALAIPSGYYGPNFGAPHHAEWTRSTRANNSVLVNGEGQGIRKAEASGRLTNFDSQEGLAYVAGDAAKAYMGKMDRFDRHVLFLHPGLVMLLDDVQAPKPAQFQWMLHALEEMEVNSEQGQVVSRRNGAALNVRLKSPAGLQLHQTNEFAVPFDAGMPDDFDEDVEPHWHMTAETVEQQKAVRIGAAVGIYDEQEPLSVEPLVQSGWQGARATGEFGTVEGWIQLEPGAPGPSGYGNEVSAGNAKLCGRTIEGKRFVV